MERLKNKQILKLTLKPVLSQLCDLEDNRSGSRANHNGDEVDRAEGPKSNVSCGQILKSTNEGKERFLSVRKFDAQCRDHIACFPSKRARRQSDDRSCPGPRDCVSPKESANSIGAKRPDHPLATDSIDLAQVKSFLVAARRAERQDAVVDLIPSYGAAMASPSTRPEIKDFQYRYFLRVAEYVEFVSRSNPKLESENHDKLKTVQIQLRNIAKKRAAELCLLEKQNVEGSRSHATNSVTQGDIAALNHGISEMNIAANEPPARTSGCKRRSTFKLF
ncbi:hypothetical protein O3G_MSEX009876 [Manduca sexta]|uniref:Uncharacterized protein n=1 Tax=Manduca sexta TaxID=7130 RepID=A0A922CRD7_MANSE|nr:hypothetical protein O3G_MSEX009876 [Manduca sexta]